MGGVRSRKLLLITMIIERNKTEQLYKCPLILFLSIDIDDKFISLSIEFEIEGP